MQIQFQQKIIQPNLLFSSLQLTLRITLQHAFAARPHAPPLLLAAAPLHYLGFYKQLALKYWLDYIPHPAGYNQASLHSSDGQCLSDSTNVLMSWQFLNKQGILELELRLFQEQEKQDLQQIFKHSLKQSLWIRFPLRGSRKLISNFTPQDLNRLFRAFRDNSHDYMQGQKSVEQILSIKEDDKLQGLPVRLYYSPCRYKETKFSLQKTIEQGLQEAKTRCVGRLGEWMSQLKGREALQAGLLMGDGFLRIAVESM